MLTPPPLPPLQHIHAGPLSIAYSEFGPSDGPSVFLMHGFPYDIHTYAEVAPALAAEGCRVIVPYLRGFGPTRFLSADTPRSGEQAALGADLLALMDALKVERATLAGYDWGGRATCVVAALWPERCTGLVSFNSYNIQDIARAMEPDTPTNEHSLWYQYYFHSERGRAGLAKDRRGLIKLLWRLWSPAWAFDDANFDRSAPAWDNPDFVDVVIQSYRHRFGLGSDRIGDIHHGRNEERDCDLGLQHGFELSHHGSCHRTAEQPDHQPGQAVPGATMRRCGQGRLRSFRVAENACHVMQVFHVFVAQN